MILIIDNYDSFTYNLVQLIGQLSPDIRVVRNDEVTVDDLEKMRPDRIVISPGPGRPEDAGISVETVKRFAPSIPILGVCLGHQAIGYAFGCRIERASSLMHGKTSMIRHSGKGLYRDIDNPFIATRYHSLIIDRNTVGNDLEITSETDDGVIMGIKHKYYSVEGIQFHPESILTNSGYDILANFI